MLEQAGQGELPAVDPDVTKRFGDAAVRYREADRTEDGRVVMRPTAGLVKTGTDQTRIPVPRTEATEVYGPEVSMAHRPLGFELVAGLMQREGVAQPS